ncbi:MAG: hypothetical protein JXA37_14690 [Chloroflexia bacterium]|nr:hypothetical protein [Chloroflexia bacterium]
MSAGKIIGYIAAGILIFFGILFIWSAFGTESQPGNLVIGIITVGVGLGIIALIRLREPKPAQEIVQKIDLSGEVSMEKLKCRECGGQLAKENITLTPDGAVMVSCPYCGSDYQIVEEPKW